MSKKSTIHQPTTGSQGEVLVRVENVSKKFCRSLKKSLWYGIQDIAHELNPFGWKVDNLASLVENDNSERYPTNDTQHLVSLRSDEFWAVRDVSFELRRGECLGLIGHNGAGKTTLLKLLNGLIKPDGGRIEMRGRVGALIALGAGFNPILTGRENIYVNASILGLSKREIDEKFDEIIDFAEIGDFIDAPVYSYSSGMQVRLGFAVATALKPDVLILDEVLAVGDARFRSKCLLRVSSLLEKCAVLFVSHSESQIRRISTTTLLLEHGQTIFYGDPDEAFRRYKLLEQQQSSPSSGEINFPIKLDSVRTINDQIQFKDDWSLFLAFSSETHITIDLVVFGFRSDGEFWSQSWEQASIEINANTNELQFEFKSISLAEGTYEISLSLFSNNGRILQYHIDTVCVLAITGRKCFHVKSQTSLFVHFPLK